MDKLHIKPVTCKTRRRPGGRLLPLAVIFVMLFSSVFIAGCGDKNDTRDTDQQQSISAVTSDTSDKDTSAKDTKKEDKKSSKKDEESRSGKSKEKASDKDSGSEASSDKDTDSGKNKSSKKDERSKSDKSKEKASGKDSGTKASSDKNTSSDKNKSSKKDKKKKKTTKYCYFTVTCHRLTEIKDELPESLQKLVPDSGVIVSRTKVKLKKNDDAFEITKRVLRAKKVHLSYQGTTQYGTAYVEAINNIYEKDVNARSGWIYKVNGTAPGVGCSAYKIKKNDAIEWAYTCDLGEDL